ncbi:hypothetical protein IV203_036312 [Nitzschia inconspicua]|uniref:Uncharacterized protein n=1 Tax=Nitzschia inconspicua TaxID=303405 RepID=A0A9K3K600_9STRA|nr:hypothetical protein IV203_006717 [Nitzschia inconspicua]KAG7361212.1 hypothetical protein IV203_036312 [Nitzschia inconspicua]
MNESGQESNEKKRSAEDAAWQTTPKRGRVGLSQDSNTSVYSPSASATIDHSWVLAYAAKNNRSRMYLPEKNNFIGEIQYENVLVDCGCSSILLPFPGDGSVLKKKYLDKLSFYWEIANSKGTGAVHSPVLKIKTHMIGAGFPCTLVGKEQPRLQYLRFHLGVRAAKTILNDNDMTDMVDSSGITAMQNFVRQVEVLAPGSARERKHALLGQLYLEHVVYCQAGPIGLMLKPPFEGNLRHYFGVYRNVVKPKIANFEGFHDLEDDDHDAEADEEERPVPWDDEDQYQDEIEDYER